MAFFSRKPKNPIATPEPEAVATEVAQTPSIKAPAGVVLRRYFVSEKSTRGFALNQYTFEIAPRATKTQVRDAVERAYKVDVTKVNIIKLPSKSRRVGRHEGRSNAIKKAIVTLKEGQAIAAAQP
jgi:large subunit ribosomal protein L23